MGRSSWNEALGFISREAGVRGISMDTYDFEASEGVVLATDMEADPAIIEYNAVYGQKNPLIERARRYLIGDYVVRASDIVPISEFVRTELYNNVHRKLGVKFLAGIGLDADPRSITQLTIVKPGDAGDFTDRELEHLVAIQPHAREAYAGFRALVETRRRLDELTSLWNLVQFAVLVVDNRHRIRFANRAAEDVLDRLTGEGSRSSGQSAAASLLRNPVLRRALVSVLASGGVRHAGTLGLLSLPQLRATVFGLQSGTAAILLTDPVRQQNLPLDALRQRFGLTTAEARVVQRLAAGESTRETAQRLSVAYETVRVQLKSAMAKNGWRRQSEMLAEIYSELLPFGSRNNSPAGA